MNDSATRYEWRDGNDVQLLINGEEFYPRVFACIAAARKEVLLETFIIYEDKVGRELQDVLIAAAQRGVNVEVTVDGYGTAGITAPYVAALTEAGVKINVFDPSKPVMGMRTNLFRRLHRKIVVVDAEIAFIGGINFSADHLGDFGPMAKQDYAVEVRGPIVTDVHRAAIELLAIRRGEQPGKQPASPANHFRGKVRMLLSLRDNDQYKKDIELAYMAAIRAANHRLIIANAYFFPGYRFLRELRNAARRGVKVTLIMQGMPDMPVVRLCTRLLYNYLLRDGVVIHEYCQRPLHGKVALADHEWATVGSSNLDPLSLSLNLEANLIIRDHRFNQQLHEHLTTLARESCKTITLERVMRGYWWRAPIIFVTFHFLRYFPAIAGWLPAHSPRLKPLTPELAAPPKEILQDEPQGPLHCQVEESR